MTLASRFRDGSFRGHRQPAAAVPSLWQQTGATAGRIIATLMAWLDRARERRALLSLSDLQLRDIGVSRAEADGEGGKPFWQT